AQQVRRINDRDHRAEAVQLHPGNAVDHREVRSKAAARKVLLRRERTLSRVERQILVEATIVVIELGLAFAERIRRHAEARRPLTGEAVSIALAALRENRADHALLLPAITEQRSDEAIDSPCVLRVGRVIVRLRVKDRIAESTTSVWQGDPPQTNTKTGGVSGIAGNQ